MSNNKNRFFTNMVYDRKGKTIDVISAEQITALRDQIYSSLQRFGSELDKGFGELRERVEDIDTQLKDLAFQNEQRLQENMDLRDKLNNSLLLGLLVLAASLFALFIYA